MILNFFTKNQLSIVFFIFAFSLLVFILFLNNKNISNNKIISCNKLNYEDSLKLKNNNFSNFELSIIIKNEREWKKGLIKNLVSYKKQNSFPNKIIEDASIIFKKNDFECLSKAKIKPHGDFSEHHVDLLSGQPYDLPSLKVDLIDSHFFGITKFILFRPISRGYNNEVLVTSIINNLGLLAPRTTNIILSYNDKKTNYIFQERIVKEFLERNELIEGPILKGDERYAFNFFKYDQNEIAKISKHKVSNGAWVKRNYNNLEVAKKALKILNFANHFHSIEINEKFIVDYFGSSLGNQINKHFEKLPLFDAVIYSLGAVHNLSKDDRRFYYDSNTEYFYPIYYDGDVNIINSENKINKKFKNIDQNWYFSMFSENINQISKIKTHTTKSAKIGSEKALILLNKLNIELLTKQLNDRGVKIEKSHVKEIVELIKENLKILIDINDNKILKSVNQLNGDLKINLNIKSKFVFDTEIKNQYQICKIDTTSCQLSKFSIDEQRLLMEQRLTSKEGDSIQYIFMGNLNDFVTNTLNLDINGKELKTLSDLNFTIKNYGDNEIHIDYRKKIIEITKNDKNGKVLISNGFIKDWEIIFFDSTINSNPDINRDKNGLTGCLNIYDAKLKNIKLSVFNSKCEDAINIVRSEGSIKDIVVLNSVSDGVDLDFSNVSISSINIKKSDGDCIDFSYGIYNLDFAKLNNCLDKGVSVGEESVVKINKANINNTKMALTSKDFSRLDVSTANVNNSRWCVQAYNKKNEFSGSLTNIILLNCNNKNKKFSEFIKHDDRSQINIQNL